MFSCCLANSLANKANILIHILYQKYKKVKEFRQEFKKKVKIFRLERFKDGVAIHSVSFTHGTKTLT